MKAVEEQGQGQEQEQEREPESIGSNESVSCSNDYAYRPLTTKHKRAGSTGTTGTTGDEEYTTDEEERYTDDVGYTISSNPVLKSDLARAASDLFGYASENEREQEPTSLFDEDDSKFDHGSSLSLPPPLFTYNEKLRNVLSRHRNLTAIAETKLTNFCDVTVKQVEHNEERSEYQSHGNEILDIAIAKSIEENVERTATDENLTKKCNCVATTRSPILKDIQVGEEKVEKCLLANPSEASLTSSVQWGNTLVEAKEHAVVKLQEELGRAHEELKLKDEEVTRLSRIRQDVETELEELTASLFQEAHNMVREANVRQANAERLLEESRMKAEVLAAEVAALKTLVLTSTPARPNPHLHPQIDTKARASADEAHQGLFTKKHRRSPSHFNLKYGRENSPPNSPDSLSRLEQRTCITADRESVERDWKNDCDKERDKECKDFGLEVDPRVHMEFLRWKAHPCVDKNDPFVGRIFREDIDLCLDFPNTELGMKVRQAVLDGIIFIEAISDKTKPAFQKKCSLLQAPRQCHYRMKLGDHEDQWYCISQICRNRIIAVCDFLNYLRYIERGLVRSSVHDVYWEITRLRKEMVFARLGLVLSS